MNRALWMLCLLAVLTHGCTSNEACVAGSTQLCTCAGGAMGAQTCSEDGTRWEACNCSSGQDSSTTSDATGNDVVADVPGADGGVDVATSDGTDVGGQDTVDPGPMVMCAMTSATATATLVEGAPGAHSTAALHYYPGGALHDIDGMACMVDPDRTGAHGDCFDAYLCGACRITISYTGTNRTLSGNCAAYSGTYNIM